MTMGRMTIRRLSAALGAMSWMGIGLAGCGWGGSGDPTPGSVTISVVTTAPRTSAPGFPDLPADLTRLSGRARIFCYPDVGGNDDLCSQTADFNDLAGQCDLVVTAGSQSPSTLELSGDLNFELGSPGSRYRLEVDLLELGSDVRGEFAGVISLDSGLEAYIDSLIVTAFEPALSAKICLSTTIDEQSESTCEDSGSGLGGSYDNDRNDLHLHYEVGDSIRTEFRGQLLPTVIYHGCTTIDENLVGGAGPIDVEIDLGPSGSTPGQVGPDPYNEQIAGTVTFTEIHFGGALISQETGTFSVSRTAPVPIPQPALLR
jgi:hypothetical protein